MRPAPEPFFFQPSSVLAPAPASGIRLRPMPDASIGVTWGTALERWLERFPWAWSQPQSPGQTLDALLSASFLPGFSRRPGGRVEARVPMLASQEAIGGSSADACAALEANAGDLVLADDIALDCAEAPAAQTPSIEEVESVARLVARRFHRAPQLRLRLEQIDGRRWNLKEISRLCSRVPFVTVQCERRVANVAPGDLWQPDRQDSALSPHQLIARLAEDVAPGTCLAVTFPEPGMGAQSSASLRAAGEIEAPPPLEYTLSMPVAIDLAPAVIPQGIDWTALREAFRAAAALAPAFVESWSMRDDLALRPRLEQRCPVTFSLTGFGKLFDVLGTEAGELRARQWVADVFQFARAEITWTLNAFRMERWRAGNEGKRHRAPEVEWEYRPEPGLLPEAGALSGGAILTQIAFQKQRRHAIRVGFRFTPGGGPEEIRGAITRGVLFGARELWVTVGARGESARSVAPSRPGALAAAKTSEAPLLVVGEAVGDWAHSLPSLASRFNLPQTEVERLFALDIACDRCRASMRMWHGCLWCPRCHHVMTGV